MREPDAPNQPSNNPALTSATQITITWTPGQSNGGTAIQSYKIVYDEGSGDGNYVTLAT